MASKSHEKIVEEIKNLTVLQLAELVKELEDALGVSAAMPVAAAPVAAAAGETAAQAEEKAEYKVTLKDGGSEKIKAIKALRAVVQGLSLSDAKKLVEEGGVIAESAPKADAQKIKQELEAAGAKVELA